MVKINGYRTEEKKMVELNGYKVDSEILGACLQAMMDGHPILLVGPMGSGKVKLAQLLGKIRGGGFRALHYTASREAVFGNTVNNGVTLTRYPGETDLARSGTLLLEDFPEFRRGVVERLSEEFAADPSYFLILTAMPCPCGFSGHPSQECICSNDVKGRHAKRLDEYVSHFPTAVRVDFGPVDPSKRVPHYC